MSGPESAEVFGARRVSFGAFAATYDAVCPEWPAKTVSWMLGSPATGSGYRVVDLGAGTGKSARAIAALGHKAIAVEPSDGMREALAASLAAVPGEVAGRISIVAGGAEDIPVETGSVDAVAAFQAWHWFDPDVTAAECARVLRPGGYLAMALDHRSEDIAWSRELSDIVEHDDDQPDHSETPPQTPEFEPSETVLFTYGMKESVEDLVRHASTWSYVAIHRDRERVLDDVRALGQQVAGSDGMIEIPMSTLCHRLRRR